MFVGMDGSTGVDGGGLDARAVGLTVRRGMSLGILCERSWRWKGIAEHGSGRGGGEVAAGIFNAQMN